MPIRTDILYTSTGSLVRLGAEIGRGGEGVVYEIVGHVDQAAKLYLSPIDSIKAAKLQTMVYKRTEALTKLAAWPSDLVLTSSKGRVAGLIMRRIDGFRAIHELYTPKSRLQEFPRATWPFLIHAATNVARAFAVVHAHSIVVGDVNQGNVMVNDAAIVALIDCDSFQIVNNGHQFICDVGVSTYTPPELQGKNLATILRTENHDNFGLALLIFHLLLMGRHPFAGRFLGRGEMPVERAIRECRFAFSAHNQALQMAPPPNALRLSDLPSIIGNLFETAFSPAASRGAARPTALQWIGALEGLSRELVKCTKTSSHHYYRQLSQCPWCSIERGTAIVLFLQLDMPLRGPLFSVGAMWLRITSVPHPGPLPRLKGRQDIAARFVPDLAAKLAGRKRKLRLGLGVAAVPAAIGICLAVNANLGGSFWIIAIAIWIAVAVGKRAQKPEGFKKAFRDAEAQYRSIQEKWQRDASDLAFSAKLRELENARNELESLPRVRHERMVFLEKNRKQIQLQRWLDRHYIRDVTLPGIGPGRKALLSSYGIDTAADLSWQALQAVNGIGPRYSTSLMSWKDSVVGRFVFNPTLGVDKAEIAKLDREIGDRRANPERTLSSGASALQIIRQRILAERESIQVVAVRSLELLLQAEANLKAC